MTPSARKVAVERGDVCPSCHEPSCICDDVEWDVHNGADQDPTCMTCGQAMDALGLECGYLTCDVCAHEDDL